MKEEYALANAAQRAQDFPESFDIPSLHRREMLRPGDLAKLCFELVDGPNEVNCNGERMWVEILRRDGDRYVGTLKSPPAFLKTIREGDEVRFGPEHVADIYPLTRAVRRSRRLLAR